MEKILQKIYCWIFFHDWTCKAEQGIAPQIGESFYEYTKMYCKRCGNVSKLSEGLK